MKNKEEVQVAVANSISFWDTAKKLNINSVYVKDLIHRFNINTEHFIKGGKCSLPRSVTETRTCPVCGESFIIHPSHKKENKKVTCSKSCSNTYFQRLPKSLRYNVICFKHHEKVCVVCGEKRVVEVHHYDENHTNDIPTNLIPLCPTCHKCYHTNNWKYTVIDKIEEYHKKFVLSSNVKAT